MGLFLINLGNWDEKSHFREMCTEFSTKDKKILNKLLDEHKFKQALKSFPIIKYSSKNEMNHFQSIQLLHNGFFNCTISLVWWLRQEGLPDYTVNSRPALSNTKTNKLYHLFTFRKSNKHVVYTYFQLTHHRPYLTNPNQPTPMNLVLFNTLL